MTSKRSLKKEVKAILTGASLKHKAIRSSVWIMIAFGVTQIIRLASNLIFTRLLYPEAFGQMAIIVAIIVGLKMFSDVGIHPAISSSPRGDDEDYLNTAWVLQIVRGVVLFLVCIIISYPVSVFYEEEILSNLLKISGISLLIMGFFPTARATAHRHLLIGRVTIIDFVSNFGGVIFILIGLQFYKSVYVLALGMGFSPIITLILSYICLPGNKNKIHFDRKSANELIQFGKWIFLSTICGFLLSQSDKLLFAKYFSMGTLGIYNIGFMIASAPILLMQRISEKVMVPIYRERAASGSSKNYAKLRKMRFIFSLFTITPSLFLVIFGPYIVHILYDDRYIDAGGILILIMLAQLPVMISITYDQAAVAAGDTRRYFYLRAGTAVIQVSGLFLGAELGGFVGALVALVFSQITSYPFYVWLARRHSVWDPIHDAVAWASCIVASLLATWLNWSDIERLTNLF